MRAFLLSLGLLAVTVWPASADSYRWCGEYGGRSGATNCYFVTLQQCRAVVSGTGGYCRPNKFYTGRDRRVGRRWQGRD